jgi:hypothetical protein
MSKNMRMVLIVAALAVVAYIAYRWYENKQAQNAQPGSQTTATGTNLNSVAPELVGGSTGPSIGPALQAPVTINITSEAQQQSTSANPTGNWGGLQSVQPVQPQNPMNPGKAARHRIHGPPSNSRTGAQAPAPQNGVTTPVTQAANAGTSGTPAVTQVSS